MNISDGKNAAGENDTSIDNWADVTITVTDVNEAPMFTGGPTTIDLAENTAADTLLGTYTVFEPDADDPTATFQTGNDRLHFTLQPAGNSGETLTYQLRSVFVPEYENPADADAGNTYELALNVNDEGSGTLAEDSRSVVVTVTDVAETETITLATPTVLTPQMMPTTSPVKGQPFTATVSGDTISNVTWQWAQGETSTGSFTNLTGATSATYTPLEAQIGKYLRVTLSYNDPHVSGRQSVSATSTVVKRGNREPEFADDMVMRSVDEHIGTDTAAKTVGDPITTTDADGDTLTYTVGDTSSFTINSATGQLSTTGAIDYESLHIDPETMNKILRFSVGVWDARNYLGDADRGLDDRSVVTVSVDNVDEPGVVTITGGAKPKGGTELTATLTDPDVVDVVTATVVWRWFRADTADGDYNAIPLAVSSSYTPVAADVGKFLQAVAVYEDGHDDGKIASAETSAAVAANNNEPAFSAAIATRAVPDNSGGGVKVGAVVTATDADSGADLTYSLGGPDASAFKLNTSTRQIATAAGQAFDFESAKKSYTVTVSVSDGIDAAGNDEDPAQVDDTVAVTINLTDVNEAPTIDSGPATVTKVENTATTEVTATYEASDVDADDNPGNLSWTPATSPLRRTARPTTPSSGSGTSPTTRCRQTLTPTTNTRSR